jgi:HPt (histidine-containing phosphotransfer) domain-containing protein
MADDILDYSAINQLLESVGGDRAFLGELIYTYVVDAPRLIELMRQAAAANDPAKLRRAAHSLKSNSANFGATHLAKLCQALEEAAQRAVLENVTPRLAEIEGEFEQVKSALAKLRAMK